jgi:glycosyltransferase involved in cell wall biosynthesis
MSSPAVSVILPTYNRADTIEASIRSVLCQSFADLELIVVDDGSSDATPRIISAIRDSRLQYHVQPNLGACAARNRGIFLSRGQYIAFQDSDDHWTLDKLDRQVSLMERSDSSNVLVYCPYLGFRRGGVTMHPKPDLPNTTGHTLPQLLMANFIGTPTMLAKADALRLIGGFDEELPRLQDWELAIRLCLVGEFAMVETPLVLARDSGESISRSGEANTVKALKRILAKHSALFQSLPEAFSKWHYRLAVGYFRLEDCPSARAALRQTLRFRPLHVRAWKAYVFGCYPRWPEFRATR